MSKNLVRSLTAIAALQLLALTASATPVAPVPETGSTLGYLLLAFCGLALFGRKSRTLGLKH
jgi:hypothetical protein